MDEFSDSTAFLLVLEFLQSFNNGNGISVNEANTYIGENYQGYVNMMTIPIEKFLRECEEKEILEKVAGAGMKVTYKINDAEELQKCIRGLALDEQEITSRKNEPVMKEERKTERDESVRIEKDKSKKKQDRGKQASKREYKRFPYRNVTESSKTETDDLHKRNDTSVDGTSSYIDKYNEARMETLQESVDVCASKEDKEVSYSQTGTRTKILKGISLRPMIPKIVLDFLTASKNSNGVSLNKINRYIAEKYQVFVKALKTSIKTFVTKCEENGILEKVIGANENVLYKIKDGKEVQKRIHDLLLEEEKLASMKNEPVKKECRKNRRYKRTPIEMDIYEKNGDSEKEVSNSDGKANFCKNMITISKTNQLGCTAMAKRGILDVLSVSQGNMSNFIINQEATISVVEKTYALHPFISRIITETPTDLYKCNGTPEDEISSYIDKYNEVRMETLQERVDDCASKEDKEVSYSQTGRRSKILKARSIRRMIPKIVLDFLTASKNSNGVSLNKINSYIAEKYQVFVKVLKTSIKTFVTKCEENGILEKVVGANKNVLYKIKDEKEVQKRMHDLLLEEEKLASKKNEPVKKEYRKNRRYKRTPIEMDISEKNGDREKEVPNSDGKANFCKKIITISKTNQLGCTAMDKKGILDALPVSHGNMSNSIIDQEATRSVIEKTYALHPFISRIITETLFDLQKRNGTSVVEISSYIYKYNEARMEILKERFEFCTSNEYKKISYSQTATRTTVLKEVSIRPLIKISKTNQLESTAMAKNDFGDGVLVAHEIISNFVTDRNANQKPMKISSPLHPLVSKLVMESRNVLSEFNGASMYEMSNYNYDAVEFKIKDVVKPEKCTLGSMKEKAEFVRNALVQKSQERNREIGSKEDMRKKYGDAGKCIVNTEDKKYSRKRMSEDSEANKSDVAYMAKKKVIVVTSDMAETNRIHQKTLRKNLQKTVESCPLAIVKNNQDDTKIVKSPIQKYLNESKKHDVFQKFHGTEAEEKFNFKKSEKNEKCKKGLKRKADTEKNELIMKKKHEN